MKLPATIISTTESELSSEILSKYQQLAMKTATQKHQKTSLDTEDSCLHCA